MTRRKPPDRHGKLRWRRGNTGYHYFEDDRFGYGHAWRTVDGNWCASADVDSRCRFTRTLAEAKKIVEREVRKIFAKGKRTAPKKR